jgi:hypothetical protein
LKLGILYLLIGGVARALAYLVTGNAQFQIDDEPTGSGRDLVALYGIPIGFAMYRWPVAVVEGLLLTWCTRRALGRRVTLGAGVGFPVGAELYFRADLILAWAYYGCRNAIGPRCVEELLVVATGTAIDLTGPIIAGWLLVFWLFRQKTMGGQVAGVQGP